MQFVYSYQIHIFIPFCISLSIRLKKFDNISFKSLHLIIDNLPLEWHRSRLSWESTWKSHNKHIWLTRPPNTLSNYLPIRIKRTLQCPWNQFKLCCYGMHSLNDVQMSADTVTRQIKYHMIKCNIYMAIHLIMHPLQIWL